MRNDRQVKPGFWQVLPTTIAVLVLAFPSHAEDMEEFVVRDMRVQGLQRISEGTVFNYLPINIGDTVDTVRIREAIRALYGQGLFSDIEIRRDGETLVGAAVLESRFIGRGKDQLQLKFLHVSRRHRQTGLGRTLFEKAVAKARELGARRLYVSSAPSENTVRFYLRRGCRVTDDVDAALFEHEPEDIHLEFDIPL